MAKEKKGLIGSIGVVIASAVVGVTAAFLSKKENREAVKKKVGEIAEEGEKKFDEAKEVLDKALNKPKPKAKAAIKGKVTPGSRSAKTSKSKSSKKAK